MKLYDFKTKYMAKLSLLKSENQRERELKQILMMKLNNLRAMNMPNLVFTLYQIIEHENVSEEFKDICRKMLQDIEKLEGD